MSQTNQPINAAWYEIPANDLDRAIRFYEQILAKPMRRESMAGTDMAVFPYEQPGVGGAVVRGPGFNPGSNGNGPVVYLTAEGQIDAILSGVVAAGGKVAMAKTELPGVGSIAHVIDTEGNRVGLHAAP